MTDPEILQLAIELANKSLCKRAKCGSVIIQNEKIIGSGFNSPAGDEPNRCNDTYQIPEHNKHDLTCCVHAEVRAIHDALSKNPNLLAGSKLYFIRLSEANQPTEAGVPYCTICSREALDSGIAEFGLWQNNQFTMYNTQDYNDKSYQYYKDRNLWNLK